MVTACGIRNPEGKKSRRVEISDWSRKRALAWLPVLFDASETQRSSDTWYRAFGFNYLIKGEVIGKELLLSHFFLFSSSHKLPLTLKSREKHLASSSFIFFSCPLKVRGENFLSNLLKLSEPETSRQWKPEI